MYVLLLAVLKLDNYIRISVRSAQTSVPIKRWAQKGDKRERERRQ